MTILNPNVSRTTRDGYKLGETVRIKDTVYKHIIGKDAKIVAFTATSLVRVDVEGHGKNFLLTMGQIEKLTAQPAAKPAPVVSTSPDEFNQLKRFFFPKAAAPKCPRCGTEIVDALAVVRINCASYKCQNYDRGFADKWVAVTYGAPRVEFPKATDIREASFLGQYMEWDLYWAVEKSFGSIIIGFSITGQTNDVFYQARVIEPMPRAHLRVGVARAIIRNFPHVKAGS